MTTSNLIALWARKGARISDHGRMCDECAFRTGTKANLDPNNARNAADCVAYHSGTFYCHMPGRQDQKCAGYLYAMELEK